MTNYNDHFQLSHAENAVKAIVFFSFVSNHIQTYDISFRIGKVNSTISQFRFSARATTLPANSCESLKGT